MNYIKCKNLIFIHEIYSSMFTMYKKHFMSDSMSVSVSCIIMQFYLFYFPFSYSRVTSRCLLLITALRWLIEK
uniref:Uncharacterized protein n=1 Tax=Anguilla anguilla TaxID=7936 RepID=A0A0E9XZ66_ANGAN